MKITSMMAVLFAVLGTISCATSSPGTDADAQLRQAVLSSFRDEGIAKLDRLQQDEMQQACSDEKPPGEAMAARIQATALATVKQPAGGRYLGDWREGEKLAQNGRGMTWSDTDLPGVNGGSCYNCHQLSKDELSFGSIGPSLYNYGKMRGVTDPNSAVSAGVVQYTWTKLWNSKAYGACSSMPRFGHKGLLTEDQLRHLMALLLDPKSPVNK